MEPTFFKTPAAFRKWLRQHHKKSPELWVGFHKKASTKPSITYPEALDEALCFGWIDGLRKSVDDDSYKIRFTPRKPSSIWSNVNVGHVERLKKEGRMQPAGLEAYDAKDPKRTGIYAFENRPKELSAEYDKQFRANKSAWTFFEKQPPYYKRLMIFRVMSAKREETRQRRLDQLISSAAKGERLDLLTAKPNKKENA
jgi:uncharacterized protein YdeI (YjbR/CyaY-like superfamily)